MQPADCITLTLLSIIHSTKTWKYDWFYLKDDVQILQARWAAIKSKKEKARVAEEQMDMCTERQKARFLSHEYEPLLRVMLQFADKMIAWCHAESRRKQAEDAALRARRLAQCVRSPVNVRTKC